jgi:hypothetical protein
VSAHFILMCDKILLQYKNQGMFGNNVWRVISVQQTDGRLTTMCTTTEQGILSSLQASFLTLSPNHWSKVAETNGLKKILTFSLHRQITRFVFLTEASVTHHKNMVNNENSFKTKLKGVLYQHSFYSMKEYYQYTGD